MIASGITKEQLLVAAFKVGVELDASRLNQAGTRHRVKVNPQRPNKYQRINALTGRRVHAVCWHGFRDFFLACFEQAPQAVFRTAMDTWNGAEDFEKRYRASGHRNVGSQMYPICAAENCQCGEEGMAV